MSIIIKYWDMVYKTKIFWNNLSVNDNNLLQNKNDILIGTNR
jgi:hypothetical protein